MILKDETIEVVIRKALQKKDIEGANELSKKIVNILVKLQHQRASSGFQKALKAGKVGKRGKDRHKRK